ncbi:MAG: VWA domain-containing protein [Holophagales bacterium]|nr:VWA domain-containing protein [Holophagales bacterium]MYD22340.1 VWA domain-containing protein [Holophagales bacterium]MYI34120.1 VWA domain-containing protein [Holophagales bacterium]
MNMHSAAMVQASRSMTTLRDPLDAARWLAALPLLVAALATAVPAQENELPAVFTETIDVRVVNIEVVVTDGDGNRVHGLEAPDFELLVDGEPMPISYFTEIEESMARASGGAAVAGVPNLEPNAPVGTNFLVFVDDLFAMERDRNRVLDRLEEDLWRVHPTDRVAVVAFDGRSIETLTGWTGSPERLAAALDRARERPTFGWQRLGERMILADDRAAEAVLEAVADQAFSGDRLRPGDIAAPADAVPAGFADPDAELREADARLPQDTGSSQDVLGSSLSGLERRFARSLEERLRRSVLAAVASMRSFGNQPGRKVMLLLAGGWPRSPALFTVADASESTVNAAAVADGFLATEDQLYGPLVSAANLIGYSLYPVDVPAVSAEFTGDASLSLGPEPGPDSLGVVAGSTNREDLLHGTLQLLARATGGVPLLNARRDAALAGAVEDTRSYYWLGFEPRRREDDAFHDVEVRLVGRPGLRVRTREGYVDMSRDREVAMTVEAALLFGGQPAAQSLEVRFSDPVRGRRRGRISVPVEVAIPLDEIQLLPVAGGWLSEVEVRVTAMDMNGARADMSVEKIRIAGPEKPGPGQFFYYQTALQLRRREHSYVIAVYDPLTGTVLTSTGNIGPK